MPIRPRAANAAAILLAIPLASCGGGGGGGMASAGSTAPPPALVNTSITDLVASQTFANDASTTTATLDTAAGTTTSASAARSTLTISYDAGSRSYTVSETGRRQTFGQADVVSTTVAGETKYKKSASGTSDYLTLVTTPYEFNTSNKYVGLGYWQRNQLSGTRQDTTFDLFTYGLDTPAAGVPRTGTAFYTMDAFAFLNVPGQAPQTLQGLGNFDVDFKSGVFLQTAFMSNYDVITGQLISQGGGLPLETSGTLSSTDGTFSGAMSFSGAAGLLHPVQGTSNGRFYGPAGEELGVTFAGSNADGATLNGGYTGQLRPGGALQNLAVTDITVKQQFVFNAATLILGVDLSKPQLGIDFSSAQGGSTLAVLNFDGAGNFTYNPNSSSFDIVNFGPSNVIDGPNNFTTHSGVTSDNNKVTVSLYNPGAGNTELPLTYASFGSWRQVGDDQAAADIYQNFFAYGIVSQPSALALRTGTAQYAGVAYGAAVDAGSKTQYAVTGTSSFNVDFSGQSFSGGLALTGVPSGGGATRDFGEYAFSGQISRAAMTSALTRGGASVGQIDTHFFGPTGQEVAGSFYANSGDVRMAGAVAAKQR